MECTGFLSSGAIQTMVIPVGRSQSPVFGFGTDAFNDRVSGRSFGELGMDIHQHALNQRTALALSVEMPCV